jgi:hypothetical protein
MGFTREALPYMCAIACRSRVRFSLYDSVKHVQTLKASFPYIAEAVAPWSRIASQLEAEGPYVDGFTVWEWSGARFLKAIFTRGAPFIFARLLRLNR